MHPGRFLFPAAALPPNMNMSGCPVMRCRADSLEALGGFFCRLEYSETSIDRWAHTFFVACSSNLLEGLLHRSSSPMQRLWRDNCHVFAEEMSYASVQCTLASCKLCRMRERQHEAVSQQACITLIFFYTMAVCHASNQPASTCCCHTNEGARDTVVGPMLPDVREPTGCGRKILPKHPYGALQLAAHQHASVCMHPLGAGQSCMRGCDSLIIGACINALHYMIINCTICTGRKEN